MPAQGVKTKKIKTTQTVNGQEKEVELEVPDIQASWGAPADRKQVGSSLTRVDGFDKVSGRAKYTSDINLPRMAWGKILRTPHAKAKIVALDLSPARTVPGVVTVFALRHVGDTLVYAGQEVAALAATSPEAAEEAVRAIRVKYEILPHAVTERAASQDGAPHVLGNERPNVQKGRAFTRGDVDGALARAKANFQGAFYAQARVHACLETHGHVVAYQSDGSLKVWASTQAVHGTADEFAGITGLPRNQIEVICEHMGGGFGSKFGPGVEGAVAARLAKESGRPIKLMLDRREEVESAGNAPSAFFDYTMAAAEDGTLLAARGRGWGTGGIGGAGTEFPYGIYRFEAVDVAQDTVLTNLGPSNAMRAPGRPQASFLTESGVDALAYQLGMDPLEMRIKNDTDPIRQDQWRKGAERFGWKARWDGRVGGRRGPLVRGVGLAGCTWGGRGGSPDMKAEVRIGTDGSIGVYCGTQDLGTGVRTLLTAIVADELRVSPRKVRPFIGNSKYPLSGGSGGSTTTPMVAPPTKMAAIQAKFEFLSALARATGEPLEKLQLLDNGAVSNGEKTLTWSEACRRLPAGGIVAQGGWVADLQTGPIRGCQFAEVEVDTETGRVRVRRVLAVQDCGIVMNRLTVVSQINGAVIQGIGFALLEDRLADAQTGRVVTASFENYKIPGPWEMPEIDVMLYEDHHPTAVSGIAEAPVIPTAAAIANAVYNACGVRIHALPITPDRVLAALGKVKGKSA